MISSDEAKLTGLAIVINRKGALDVTIDGEADILSGASECSLNSPNDSFELNCEWEFDDDYAGARKKLGLLRMQLNACLPQRLADEGAGTGVEGLEVPFEYETAIENEDAEETEVRLVLYRYTRTVPARYSVDLSIYR